MTAEAVAGPAPAGRPADGGGRVGGGRRPGRGLPSDGRERTGRLVTALVAVACLAPIVASAVEVGRGWAPASDAAIIATRARDTFTERIPLLGQPSTAGATVGEQVHHPGPLELWAIGAGQQVVDGPGTSLVVVALVNAAAVLSILWWVRALGGVQAMAMTALPLVTLLWSLRGETLVDPLNPSAAVLPFAAFLVALVAVGRRRAWATLTAVLAGSWASQAHLTVTGLVVAASVATAVVIGVRRLRAGPERGGDHPGRRPLLVALVAFLLCWSGPLVDFVVNDGGNVAALAATSGAVPAQPGGVGDAVDRAVQVLSWRPVWAEAGAALPRVLTVPSAGDRLVVAGVWLVGLLTAVANRRGAPALGWAFGLATVVLLTGTALLSRLPGSFFNVFQPGNYLWLWPAGALLWSSAVGGVLVLVETLWGRRGPPAVRPVGVAVPLVLTGAVALASVVTPSHRTIQRDGPAYIRALGSQLVDGLDPSRSYGLDLSFDLTEQVVDVGLLQELERRGFELRVGEVFRPSFGPLRASGLAGTAGTLVVDLGRTPPAPPAMGAALVASYRPPARLAARLDAAERAVAARIDRAGGADRLLFPALGIDPPATTLAFVRGDFLGLTEIGLIPAEVARWPETRELVAVRAQPVLHAAVSLLPPGTSPDR